LPSCRKLSSQLGVSRNTVSLVYDSLLDDGYLISKPRSGYYLSEKYQNPSEEIDAKLDHFESTDNDNAPDWSKRVKLQLSQYPRIVKPSH
ncbi:GntR family transcriptional regulator, partial [Vibrio coralliirubri]